jgi:hypothetical protein
LRLATAHRILISTATLFFFLFALWELDRYYLAIYLKRLSRWLK